MKDVVSIYDFVTSIRGGKNLFPGVKDTNNQPRMLSKLARGFEQNRFSDDEQAIKFLYGTGAKGESYRKLKSRFKERLLDFILAHDSTRLIKSPYDKSLFHAQRTLLAAQLLYMRDHRIAAVALLKPVLHSSVYYNHLLPSVAASRLLGMYAAYTGSKREWNHYKNEWQKNFNAFNAETEMEITYLDSVATIFNITDYSPVIKKLLFENYQTGKKIYRRFKTYSITLYYYRLAIAYYHSINRFEKIITLSRQCMDYIRSHPQFYQRTRAGEFALIEMEACLRLQRFDEGMKCAQQCLRHYVPGTSHWIVFNRYYFYLAMQTGNYLQALQIFNEVNPSGRSSKIPEIERERWRISEAYLNFALPDSLPKNQFRLFKFLNQVETAGQDKAGYGFSILIAKIILLINVGDRDQLHELYEPFRKYMKRYIRADRHPRQHYFGSMIRILLWNNYDEQKSQKLTTPYFKKLTPSNGKKNLLEETEIIPYDILWEMILDKCRVNLKTC